MHQHEEPVRVVTGMVRSRSVGTRPSLGLIAMRGRSEVGRAHVSVVRHMAIWAGSEALLSGLSVEPTDDSVAAALVREAEAMLARHGVSRLAVIASIADPRAIAGHVSRGYTPRMTRMVADPAVAIALPESAARQVTIRRFLAPHPESIGALKPLWCALVSHMQAVDVDFGPGHELDVSWDLARQLHLRVLAPGDDGFILVAERGGALLGYALVTVGDTGADLEVLSVLPGERGGGIGSALIAAARAEVHGLGIGRLVAWVLVRDGVATGFYERNGFMGESVALATRLGHRVL